MSDVAAGTQRPPAAPWLAGALIAVTLAGFGLRLILLDRYPFREDEAIYSYWALHGWHVDPLFLQVWPDKPPAFVWLLTLAYQAWGVSPAAARFLNIVLSTLTIPVLAVTARRWWGPWAALGAALLASLSPFAISFAPTAFTDPMMVLAGSLALALIARRYYFASGVALAVSIMTKQQGALFVPLVIAAGLFEERPPAYETVRPARSILPWLTFLAGFALVVLPVLYWDSLRWAVAPSPWDLGARNVGAVTLTNPAEWGQRLRAWLDQTWYLLAGNVAWLLVGGIMLVAAVTAVRRRVACTAGRKWTSGFVGRFVKSPYRPASTPTITSIAPTCTSRMWVFAVVLAAWAAGFLGLHIVTSVQVWDRYLLPLVIPLALLSGWAITVMSDVPMGRGMRGWMGTAKGRCPDGTEDGWGRRGVVHRVLVVVVIFVMVGPAWQAALGQLPIGGDHGAYSGLDAAFDYVQTMSDDQKLTLYQRELGWHARFYLYDALERGDVDLRYYPSAAYVADSASKLPGQLRLLIVPDWAPVRDLDMQLAARGLVASVRQRAGHFTVYALSPDPRDDASWRVCRPQQSIRALTAPGVGAMMCRQ